VDTPSENNDLNSKFDNYEYKPKKDLWDRISGEMEGNNTAPLAGTFEAYGHEPKPQVWENIASELHPNRKRRFVYWWWTAAAGIALLIGGYFMSGSFTDPSYTPSELNAHSTSEDQVEMNSDQHQAQETNVINPDDAEPKDQNETIPKESIKSNQKEIARKEEVPGKSKIKVKLDLGTIPVGPELALEHVDIKPAFIMETINDNELLGPVLFEDLPNPGKNNEDQEEHSMMELAGAFSPFMGADNIYYAGPNELMDTQNSFTGNGGSSSIQSMDPYSYELADEVKFLPPMSLGADLNFKIKKRFSIGSGIKFIRLRSRTELNSGPVTSYETNTERYLGVPVKVNYNIIDGKKFDLTTSLGGQYEFGAGGKKKTTNVSYGQESTYSTSLEIGGGQANGSLSVGTNYNIGKRLGIYLETSFTHYFYQTNYNLWSTKRIWLGFNTGIRIDL